MMQDSIKQCKDRPDRSYSGIPPGWGVTRLRIAGPAKTKELIYTGKMITAEELEEIGLVNRVISLNTEEEEEKQSISELAKILNKKLMDECLSLANEIANNSFTSVKTSKMLTNKGMEADINTGLQLEVYGWALCLAHEDRQKMMLSFLNKSKKK